MTENGKYLTIDKYLFRKFFDNISYSGCARVAMTPISMTTIVSAGSSSSQWETDIIEKIRAIARSSGISFEDIFRKFDEDGNGVISQTEFRNAIRRLNLGLSSREIDKLMTRVDTNSDGKIDYKEFITKFKPSELDDRLKDRSRDKLARFKELMILHMTSPADAFRLVIIFKFNSCSSIRANSANLRSRSLAVSSLRHTKSPQRGPLHIQ